MAIKYTFDLGMQPSSYALRSGEYKHRFDFRRGTRDELMVIVKFFARVVLRTLCRQKGNNPAKWVLFSVPKRRLFEYVIGTFHYYRT